MRAIDTNVLVRLIVRDDGKQLRIAQEFISIGVWVSHVVLVETLWVLERNCRVDRKAAASSKASWAASGIAPVRFQAFDASWVWVKRFVGIEAICGSRWTRTAEAAPPRATSRPGVPHLVNSHLHHS